MLLLLVNDLAQAFSGRVIFQKVNFELEQGEKVALVGANGVGKSSLLRLLAGVTLPAAGRIQYFKPVKTVMLTEELDCAGETTVADYLTVALSQTAYRANLGEGAKRFGFTSLDARPVKTLSGGEKTRLQLAKLWLAEPDLLLLDEPTNHLDSAHLDWLEQFVREFRGTVLIVSHDRYFLDRSVTRVMELQAEGITSYPGNYSAYARAKQLRYEQDLKTFYDQERRAKKLQKVIAEQEQWAERGHRESRWKARSAGGFKEYYRAKAQKLERRVKNNIKRLNRLQEEQIAKPRPAAMVAFNFQAVRSGNNCLITGREISKSYGPRPLFKKINLGLEQGQKIGLIGPNGSGKTTLLKMVLAQEPVDSGSFWRSPALRPGYLDQELLSLDETATVLEAVSGPDTDPKAVRNLLAGLLFKGDTVYQRCAYLSMGERVRVGLAKLLVADCNLLILDEPTNYLDLPSRERLEDTLRQYQGALLLVAHDRYLLDRVCTGIWSIEDQELRTYPGNYSEYLASRSKLNQAGQAEQRLQLELRKARVLGELSQVDRQRRPQEYQRLEGEYVAILSQLQLVQQRKN